MALGTLSQVGSVDVVDGYNVISRTTEMIPALKGTSALALSLWGDYARRVIRGTDAVALNLNFVDTGAGYTRVLEYSAALRLSAANENDRSRGRWSPSHQKPPRALGFCSPKTCRPNTSQAACPPAK